MTKSKNTNPSEVTAGWPGPHSAVDMHQGTPTLMVNGQPAPGMYFTKCVYNDEGYVRSLGESGMRVFFVPHEVEGNGKWQADSLTNQINLILRLIPDAWIVLRTGLNPSEDWMKAHPAEMVQFEDGTPVTTWFKGHIQCLNSQQWREDQCRELGGFLDWLRVQPFVNRVIGFFLCAGGTGEWYIPAQLVQDGGRTLDHSPAFKKQFTDYLRANYGDDDTLRKAWNRPEASIDAPSIPSAAQIFSKNADLKAFAIYHGTDALPGTPEANNRGPQLGALDNMPDTRNATTGGFLNPDTSVMAADYYAAIYNGICDSIIHFARFLKQRTGGTLAVGSFGGAIAHFTKVLESGVVDFLSTPGGYTNRKPGDAVSVYVAHGSFRIRRKCYVIEDDTRTFTQGPVHAWGVNTIGESIEVMKRDFGRNLSMDLVGWWFDMCGHDGGNHFYQYPKILALIKRQQEVMASFYQKPRNPPAEIALIRDDESATYAGSWTMEDVDLRFRSFELHRIGVPVASHCLEDLWHPDMPDYKFYIFQNAFALDTGKRDRLRAFFAAKKRTVLWLYAPGVIQPDGNPRFSSANITGLTGVLTDSSDGPALPYCHLTEEGTRQLHDARADWDYGWFTDRDCFGTCEAWTQGQGLAQFTLLYPYFYADDPQADVLMRFNADERPALVKKEGPGGTCFLAYFKAVRSDLVRSMARQAGCHVYSASDDILYAGNRFVTLHASSSGNKVIRFNRACNPYEVYERRLYGLEIREITVRMRKGETRTFHLDGKF